VAELGNPLKSANFGKVGVLQTLQQSDRKVTFRSRRVMCVTRMREWPISLEPAEGVNDVAVDHHFKVEVAARRGAGGPAHSHDVAARDLLADLDR
jgi:hypothetical protein